MKKIASIILILCMGLGLFSCFEPIDPVTSSTSKTTNGIGITTRPTGSTTNGTGNTNNGSTTRPNSTSGTSISIPQENPDLSGFDVDELELFEELFNYENHISFYLDISDSELKKIQKDYEKYSSMGSKSPIYRMANLHVTITRPNGEWAEYVIEQVGVRMKGNTSRTNFWDSSAGMYNLIHFKVSFQETFDDVEYYGNDALVWTDDAARKARKNRTFATLEKIDIRWNKNDDSTYIREIYAYDLYREFGVLAPHVNLASVDIGDDHAGVWTFYEPIDKTFLEKNLSPEALGGDLYKLGWAGSDAATFTSFSSYGIEDEDAGKFYVYDLKTNKKTSDHSSLKNVINTLKSSSCQKSNFEAVVDVDNFLMFAAVSYMIGNPDDLRNNYNNCYIYFRADNGKMMIIPYDMDRGLGVSKDWNPYGNYMSTDSPYESYNVCGDQRNPLFKKGILNSNFFKNEYTDALKLVASSEMLTESKFAESYNVAKRLYENDATPSKQYGNAWNHSFSFDLYKSDGSNMSFSNYINAKKSTLAKYISEYTPDVDNSGSGSDNTQIEWDLYLRGNFNNNNWSNQSQYKFKNLGNGLYSVEVSCSNQLFKFKVYNNKQSGDEAWYNTVDESKTTVWFEYQGGNRNVQVKAGSYTVYFDTNTQTIYIES